MSETDEQRRDRLKGKGWIGVDLDGTLAEWHGWDVHKGGIGAPIQLMVDRVKAWLQDGIEVRVFTARVALGRGEFRDVQGQRAAIDVWTFQHIGRTLTLTCEKDPDMIELWDDRCVQVVRNVGTRADGRPG